MSRIFEALKKAEKKRQFAAAAGARKEQVEPPEIHGLEHLPLHVPIWVYGHTPSQEPFYEEIETLAVHAMGALLPLSIQVIPGQRLLLMNKATQKERKCTVVWLGKAKSRKTWVEVAFREPAIGFWKVTCKTEGSG